MYDIKTLRKEKDLSHSMGKFQIWETLTFGSYNHKPPASVWNRHKATNINTQITYNKQQMYLLFIILI